MLGALRLMGFGIDPMNMLTPFLIFAIAVSHGEQMINRFRGEIFFGGLEEGTVEELRQRASTRVPPLEAARLSFRMLLVPGAVALLAGCIGFGAIMVHPDPTWCANWRSPPPSALALTILTDLILLPVLLSYTAAAQHRQEARVPPAPADPVRQGLGDAGRAQPPGPGRDRDRASAW